MRKGRPGSRRDTHIEATMLTPSRLGSQKAPVSWHKLAPEFGESKQTLVKIWPVSVFMAAAPAKPDGNFAKRLLNCSVNEQLIDAYARCSKTKLLGASSRP